MKGAGEMVAKLRAIGKAFPPHAGAAVQDVLKDKMVIMKERTPVQPPPGYPPGHSGTLRDSGQVGEPEFKGKAITVPLGFGAPGSGAEDYAIVQHEHLEFHHEIGQAKYAESVLNESVDTIGDEIAQRAHLDKLNVP
jgi:hypothetical protein